ncbi:MAG: hypothetical protein AB7P03_06550 [Kofleriaceae bacterium]
MPSRAASIPLDPKLLEQALGKRRPAKYRAFITSRRYRRFNGHAFPELPTISVDESWPLRFDAQTEPERPGEPARPRSSRAGWIATCIHWRHESPSHFRSPPSTRTTSTVSSWRRSNPKTIAAAAELAKILAPR